MARQLVCPHGHRWDVGNADAPSSAHTAPLCPVCRAPAVASPPKGAAAPTPQTEALVPEPSQPPRRALPSPPTLPPTPSRPTGASAELPTIPGYELLGELGRGGMGVVYWAWQPDMGRTVALKLLLAGVHASPQERARFHTKAEAVGRLHPPHIAQINGIGRREEHLYLVPEYVDGGSLAQQLTGTLLPVRKAAELVATLARPAAARCHCAPSTTMCRHGRNCGGTRQPGTATATCTVIPVGRTGGRCLLLTSSVAELVL